MPRFKITENKADGNCGFHAYALSLMYYLLQSQQNKQNKQNLYEFKDIFGLSQNNFNRLNAMLTQKRESPEFSEPEANLIQLLLSPKLREMASIRTFLEFMQNPKGTEIHAAVNFKLRQLVKEQLEKINPANAQLIELATSKASDYETSEVLKVEGFEQRLNARAMQVVETIKQSDDHTKISIDQLFNDQTTEFFTHSNNQNLNTYVEHIQTDKQWATEEQLKTLHRAVTGEEINPNDNQYRQERSIALQIYHDKKLVSGQDNANQLGIGLNNQGNNHWNSVIFDKEQDFHYQSQYEKAHQIENEYKANNVDVESKLDDFIEKTGNEELKNLYHLAKEEIKTDQSHQVAYLFFERFKEIEGTELQPMKPNM